MAFPPGGPGRYFALYVCVRCIANLIVFLFIEDKSVETGLLSDIAGWHEQGTIAQTRGLAAEASVLELQLHG